MSDDLVLLFYWRYHIRYVDRFDEIEEAVRQAWGLLDNGAGMPEMIEVIRPDGTVQRFDPNGHEIWGRLENEVLRREEREQTGMSYARVEIDRAILEVFESRRAQAIADELRPLLGDRVAIVEEPT